MFGESPDDRRIPKALRRMRERLTEARKREVFLKVKGREPSGEDELEAFIYFATIEAYNSGDDDL